MKPAAMVILLLIAQIGLLVLPDTVAIVAAVPLAVVLTQLSRRPLRAMLRPLGGITALLLMVLVVRLISVPSWATLYAWGGYAARLLISLLLVLSVVFRQGITRLHRGILEILRPLPRWFRNPLGDVIGSALYMIPAVTTVLREIRGTVTIRYAGASGGALTRIGALSRSAVVVLSRIPRPRAEAMVVRGIIQEEEPT